MSLAEFQDTVRDYLFNPDSRYQCVDIPQLAKDEDFTKQFDVIRERTLSSLMRELAGVFPITKRLLSEAEFRIAADQYFSERIPSSIDPMNYCEEFPDFLENFTTEKDLPYLVEIAMLDYGCYQAKQAMDAQPINKKIFTELSPEQLAGRHIQLHPACFWMSSPFSLYDVWYRFNSSLPSKASAALTPQEVVIIRPQMQVEVHKVDTGLVRALDALDNGETLNKALMEGGQEDPNFNAVAAIQFLIQNGLIVNLY